MNLKAFSLLETVVALSILAFVITASMFHIGDLFARSQINMGNVYLLVKSVENTFPIKEKLVDGGAFQVESSISKYSSSLDVLTVRAQHKNGRSILVTRKLIRHVEQ